MLSHRNLFAIVQRRRFLVAMAARAGVEEAAPRSGPQGRKRKKGRFDFFKYVDETSPQIFRRMYRMEYKGFLELLDLLRDRITTVDTDQADRNCGAITPEVRLAMTLRFLAGGQVHDIMMAFRVYSFTGFYGSVWKVRSSRFYA
jgi:hypothetical protein